MFLIIEHFEYILIRGISGKTVNQSAEFGSFDHSWHIGNRIFTRDLFEILKGDLDRSVIPTRAVGMDGKLKLIRPND